jgi:IS605 OrfB family transposase
MPTLEIYRKALSFYINTVYREWNSIKDVENTNAQVAYLEKITHKTAKNPDPAYDFDKDFYKFPSYLRRACIAESIGYVKGFFSSVENYEQEKAAALSKGKKFRKKPPVLQLTHNSFPVLYKPVMFIKQSDSKVKIKAYVNNDWVWLDLTLDTRNLLSSKKYRFTGYKELNPVLVQKGKHFYLHIPYLTKATLKTNAIDAEIAIGVDLGLTKSAVCCAVNKNGTVIGRLFINQPIEKDRLFRTINRLSKAKRQSGCVKAPNYWRVIKNIEKQIVQDTADRIVEFAVKHNADVIVFENLGRMKQPKDFYGAKKLRFKLHFWAKQAIVRKTLQQAHFFGIRIAKVLAKGTSKYAFDGSGEVERNAKRDLCRFTTNKHYHSDLNASYNIAARFFIKFFLKPLPEMVRLQLQAKVPETAARHQQTLSSLIRLREALSLVA